MSRPPGNSGPPPAKTPHGEVTGAEPGAHRGALLLGALRRRAGDGPLGGEARVQILQRDV